MLLRMLTATTKVTTVTSQQSSTHQPLPLPLKPSTQPLCLLRVMSASLHPEIRADASVITMWKSYKQHKTRRYKPRQLRNAQVRHFQVLHFQALRFGPSFSGLAFSGPVNWSVIFQGLCFRDLRFGPSFFYQLVVPPVGVTPKIGPFEPMPLVY